MTTFQDPPPQSRRAVRQSERGETGQQGYPPFTQQPDHHPEWESQRTDRPAQPEQATPPVQATPASGRRSALNPPDPQAPAPTQAPTEQTDRTPVYDGPFRNRGEALPPTELLAAPDRPSYRPRETAAYAPAPTWTTEPAPTVAFDPPVAPGQPVPLVEPAAPPVSAQPVAAQPIAPVPLVEPAAPGAPAVEPAEPVAVVPEPQPTHALPPHSEPDAHTMTRRELRAMLANGGVLPEATDEGVAPEVFAGSAPEQLVPPGAAAHDVALTAEDVAAATAGVPVVPSESLPVDAPAAAESTFLEQSFQVPSLQEPSFQEPAAPEAVVEDIPDSAQERAWPFAFGVTEPVVEDAQVADAVPAVETVPFAEAAPAYDVAPVVEAVPVVEAPTVAAPPPVEYEPTAASEPFIAPSVPEPSQHEGPEAPLVAAPHPQFDAIAVTPADGTRALFGDLMTPIADPLTVAPDAPQDPTLAAAIAEYDALAAAHQAPVPPVAQPAQPAFVESDESGSQDYPASSASAQAVPSAAEQPAVTEAAPQPPASAAGAAWGDAAALPSVYSDPSVASSAPAEPQSGLAQAPEAPLAPAPQRPSGHWSAQAAAEDDPTYENVNRNVGSATGATSALVLPTTPERDIRGALSANGEIMLTGSIDLPSSLSSRGTTERHDHQGLDSLFDGDDDHELVQTDSQPVRAVRAVSTHATGQGVTHTQKPKGTKLLTGLLFAAVGMALVGVGLLVTVVLTNVL